MSAFELLKQTSPLYIGMLKTSPPRHLRRFLRLDRELLSRISDILETELERVECYQCRNLVLWVAEIFSIAESGSQKTREIRKSHISGKKLTSQEDSTVTKQ